ncbi:hypothetical protein CVT24_005174 [Panaeolus cyanescens]|uniref:Major facilitator superfamily (MFS) profile domain-containing protein n=1 Tax=Panaeolus cyanescens TaxID=181874 RepID=A0A409Y9E4_9AGAR|nr:hypothetical protein CVT24_005174 [Panaeolus cyanescens]
MDPEKTSQTDSNGTGNSESHVQIYERPRGFKGLYSHPITQTCMLGLVCFMGPGLFNALNGLGGGGQLDPTTSANANAILYGTFAFFAFFAGTINNRLGAKVTLLLGTTGYSLYVAGYLVLNIHPHAGAFLLTAGAILGACAGLLWTAQGSLMLAYPTEAQKGKFIGLFWCIFNLGAVVGACVSLGQNFNSKSNVVSNGTYIGFLILTLIGVCIPLLMVSPENIVRTDGTRVALVRHPSWKIELYGLWVALRTDPLIVLLFPMFFASNWFYAWQFNDFNDAFFNIRARSLNNLVYWLSQMVGSIAIGALLDRGSISRRARAFSGWVVLFVMVFVVHIWGFFYQRQYTRASFPPGVDVVKMDIFDKGYAGRIIIYIFCGLLDAMWQTMSYWIMGAMSNDPSKLAYFAGFYKSIQSAGGAGSWRADGVKTPFMNMFISTWTLLVAGLLFALPMIHLRVKNQTDLADETLLRMDDSGKIRDVGQEN